MVFCALSNHNEQALLLALEKGASPNGSLSGSGDTPLHWATTENEASLLRRFGASTTTTRNAKGETPLDSAVRRGDHAVAAILREMAPR
jgi:hypothetical protein